MFLPTTRAELKNRGWQQLDVILISGDAYIDSPSIGVAVIGRVLEKAGYRVGIIGQPDPDNPMDIMRLGQPRLFWGISGGSVDSLVANRTASGKRRKQDDYTPGGENTKRPDRAVIVYANLVRRHSGSTAPIVLGGIEASLRRIAHYDFWSDSVRRSILFDAKADYLLYGMGEKSVVELAACLRDQCGQKAIEAIRGLCYKSKTIPPDALVLPSHQEVRDDKKKLLQAFSLFYANTDPVSAQQLTQQQDSRYLVHNPPSHTLSSLELDAIYELEYEHEAHPFHLPAGPIRALDTIRFSLTSHRGCYGECNFCAIAVHQGRTVQWRSISSLVRETQRIRHHPLFKGIIQDVGGPTANMYGFECAKKLKKGACKEKRCLFPSICPSLPVTHQPQRELLEALRHIPGIRQLRVASGLRYDLILADNQQGGAYLSELIRHHIGGQLKIAPEHSHKQVLELMGKPGVDILLDFKKLFTHIIKEEKRDLYLTYYLIAAHPGCTRKDMEELRRFCQKKLHGIPRQVQIFTPTPSTWSSLMYWTGIDPFSGKKIFVEKSSKERDLQKAVLLPDKRSTQRPKKLRS